MRNSDHNGARIFVLGDIAIDQMYFVPSFPTHGGEVTATGSFIAPGGSASNVAVTLAKLGEHVALAARCATDALGKTALEHLAKCGVDTTWVQFDAARPTSMVALFVTPDAERTMVSVAGASRYLDVNDFDRAAVREQQAVVFSAYAFMGVEQRAYAEAAMEAARTENIPVIIDIGTAAIHALGAAELLSACAGAAHLLMNEHELTLLTGSGGTQALHDQGFASVVVKHGPDGSTVSHHGATQAIPPHLAPAAIDATGAGDAFTAGFTYGVVRGWSTAQAARLGNVLGSLTTQTLGGQSLELDRDAVLAQAGLVEG